MFHRMRERASSKKAVHRLCLTIALLVALGILLRWIYFLPDKRHVIGIYTKLEDVQRSGDFVLGYELMSSSYRKTHTTEEFKQELPTMFYGILGSPNINWSRTEAILAPGMWAGGPKIRFSKIEGKWFCDGIIDWYYD